MYQNAVSVLKTKIYESSSNNTLSVCCHLFYSGHPFTGSFYQCSSLLFQHFQNRLQTISIELCTAELVLLSAASMDLHVVRLSHMFGAKHASSVELA